MTTGTNQMDLVTIGHRLTTLEQEFTEMKLTLTEVLKEVKLRGEKGRRKERRKELLMKLQRKSEKQKRKKTERARVMLMIAGRMELGPTVAPVDCIGV